MNVMENHRLLALASLLAAASVIALVPAAPAGAQTVDWTGSTDSDWDTGSNWDTNAVPAAGDDVVVDDISNNEAWIGSGVVAQADSILVGELGDALLHILNGGTLTTTAPSIAGWAPGSEGLISIAGLHAQWNSNDTIILGYEGSGVLAINAQGHLANNGHSLLGLLPGSEGVAIVGGVDSSWTNTGNLVVGVQGSGLVDLSSQGQLTSDEGYIGAEAGGAGAVNVYHSGSQWNVAQGLYVGFRGFGTLDVSAGGTVSSSAGVVGFEAGSTGKAALSGAGTTWSSGNGIVVGYEGSGTLSITDGALLASGLGFVAQEAGSTGDVTVSGAGSTWTNTGLLQVGGHGKGSLAIEDGGTVTVGGAQMQIAFAPGGTGSVEIAQGTLAVAGALLVGGEGDGTLAVDGGAVTSGFASLGHAPDGTGSAVLADASSWQVTSTLNVGHEGAGELTLDGGSQVQSSNGYVGTEATGVGLATIGDGSSWDMTGDLHVGHFGEGRLRILDGGAVNSAQGLIGAEAGSQGAASVGGTGSSWTMTGQLFVGHDGEADLVVSDGGTVSNATASIATGAGSSGSVTVTGAGSAWTSTGSLGVGGSGAGSLAIAEGGKVSSGVGSIANNAGSTGVVTVDGEESSWDNTGDLHVGFGGVGELAVADGGAVSSDNGFIGINAGSQGEVTVAGAGSTWSNAGNLFVGVAGVGELTIADGATVATGGGATQVAALAGSTGTLNIGAAAGDAAAAPGTLGSGTLAFGSGDGTVVFNHTADGFVFAPSFHGLGTIAHYAGTTLLSADSSGFSGAVHVHGGSLLVDGILGGSVAVHDGALLGGSGTVGTTTVGPGGTIAPGNSIGTLVVDGNYVQGDGSTYQLEMDAAGNSDLIDVAGTAQLDGGTVQVLLLDGVAPMDAPYTILTAAGGLAGTFDALETSIGSTLFLAPTLDYDSNNVYFLVAQGMAFADAALTPNQVAAASAADSLGPGNVLWDAIAQLTDEADAHVAFDALSGEVHASLKAGLVEDSRFMRDAVNGRLRSVQVAGTPDGTAAWGMGYGSRGHIDGDGNAARLDRSARGFFVGADIALGEAWRGGIAIGRGKASYDIDDRMSSADVDSNLLAAYAGARFANWGLRFGAVSHWHDVDTRRAVAFPGFATTAEATYEARTTQLFGEAGYRIETGAAAVEPFAGLAYVKLDADAAGEGGSAGLEAAGEDIEGLFATLGLRAAKDIAMRDSRASLYGSIGWRHAFDFGTIASRHRFAAGGDAFIVEGVPVAENVALLEAGLAFALSRSAVLTLSYNGWIGGGMEEHGANALLSVRF